MISARNEAPVMTARPLLVRFSTQDRILLAKRLGMILRSGLPIMEGLSMLSKSAHSRSAAYIFENLTVTVSSGQPLSAGLAKFENIFGEFCVNIIRVGEASGTLHENLEYLAEEIRREQSLRRKVVGALLYPALIIVATFGISILLTVYIFPKILPIFTSIKATLPLSTRMLIVISAFLSDWWLWLIAGIVACIVGFFFLLRIESFRYVTHRTLLRLPLLGSLAQNYNLTNIARTLALLLKSAVPIAEGMELVAASTKNRVYRKALLETRDRLVKGQKISMYFEQYPQLFPPIMTQMVAVGESTGNLSTTLSYLSDMYEEEIDELTKHLTTLLEPVLMIVMGLVVGFIAISIITPIYSITQSLTPH